MIDRDARKVAEGTVRQVEVVPFAGQRRVRRHAAENRIAVLRHGIARLERILAAIRERREAGIGLDQTHAGETQRNEQQLFHQNPPLVKQTPSFGRRQR